MPSYILEKPIKSASISIELLQEIERYLLEQGKNQLTEGSRLLYSISIYDKYGQENIKEFNGYHRLTLPNGTKRVVMKISDYTTGFSIKISFSKEIMYSNLIIDISGNSAKESSYGISTTINSHLNEHKNLNFIFHGLPTYFVWMLFVMSGFIVIIDFFTKKINPGTLISSILFITSTIYFVLKTTNPYSQLDTNNNRKIMAAEKWIINGFASVFVFGLLAHFIRRKLIGF